MAKTIKQIAEELGVSKTSVMKKIDNLGLRSSLQKNANQFAIDEEQESLIKSAFEKKQPTTDNRQPVVEKSESLQLFSDVIETLKKQLEEKDKQLDAKDRQIEQLNERLAESQKLIDQQQQLSAIVEQKLSLLEKKEEESPAEQPKRHWWNFRSKH